MSLQPATGGTDSANANLINPRTNKNRNNDRSSPTSPFARSTDNRSHSRSRTPPICYANGFGDVSSGHRWLTHGHPDSSLVDPRCRARSARGWRASCWVPTMVAPSNRLCIPGAARAAATGPSAVLGFSTPPRSRVHHGTTATSSTAANSDPAWRPMASPVLPSIHRADPPVTRFRATCHILNRRYKLRFTFNRSERQYLGFMTAATSGVRCSFLRADTLRDRCFGPASRGGSTRNLRPTRTRSECTAELGRSAAIVRAPRPSGCRAAMTTPACV